MKPYVTFLLLVFALFSTSCGNQEQKDAQTYLAEADRLLQERHEDAAGVIAILTEGLIAHPDSLPLLQSRAGVYCGRGFISECRADAARLLALKPERIEPRMMLCMLDEWEGADAHAYEACYREVASLYAALPPASSREAALGDKLNYVLALLMARHPDADKEKNVFLRETANDPQAWVFSQMLDDFDRKRVLREIFGK